MVAASWYRASWREDTWGGSGEGAVRLIFIIYNCMKGLDGYKNRVVQFVRLAQSIEDVKFWFCLVHV